MFPHHAEYFDARQSTFNNVGGDQVTNFTLVFNSQNTPPVPWFSPEAALDHSSVSLGSNFPASKDLGTITSGISVELLKALIELGCKIKDSADQNKVDLVDDLLESLQALRTSIEDRQFDVDDPQFRRFLTTLQGELQGALDICQQNTGKQAGECTSSLKTRDGPDDAKSQIYQTARKLNRYHQTFSAKHAACMQRDIKEVLTEMRSRLGRVELELQRRTGASPATTITQDTIGIQSMSYLQGESIIRPSPIFRVLRTRNVEHHARKLHALSWSLHDLGDYEYSLQISFQVIQVYRRRASKGPGLFDVPLVDSLRLAAICLEQLGDFHRASKLSEAMVREFAGSNNNSSFLIMHSSALDMLSFHLGLLGRCEEAVRLIHEALAMQATFSNCQPEVFLPTRARSLVTASLHYSFIGQYDEALQVARRAVEINSTLARIEPELYEVQFASSLHATAMRLVDQGRWRDALSMASDALKFRRKPTTRCPQKATKSLAWSLMLNAHCNNNLGQFHNALVQIKEAIEQLRLLIQDLPVIGKPWLAVAYAIASLSLSYIGCPEEALRSAKESLAIYRAFVQDHARLIHPDLATTFAVLADFLEARGCVADALEARQNREGIERVLGRSVIVTCIAHYRVG